jgi:hypothetical protein
MEYQVIKKININKSNCKKVGAFLYDKELDAIYLDCPWWFPVQISLTQGLSRCEVTPGFLKLPFILKGWVNEDILLRLVDVMKYALKDKIMMHASCVDDTLIVGFPNSGKTYQTYKSVHEGGNLVSEEYTIIDKKGFAHAYKPMMRTCFSPSTIKDCHITITLGDRLKLFISGIRALLMPFMFEHAIWKEIPVTGRPSKIKKIVFGSSGREVKDWKEFAILCENEFPFMASEMLQAYAVATGLDIISIQNHQRNLIKNFVESVYPINSSTKS